MNTMTNMERFRWVAAVAIVVAGMVPSARAQDVKNSPEKVTAEQLQKEIDAFVKGVLERKDLDDVAKALVTKVALRKLRQPRLVSAEKIEVAVDRIREVLSGPKGADVDTSQKIREAAATWLVEQARSADPVVAANAALLLGDLRAEGKPWLEGSKRLAGIAADADLKTVVRAAAIAGLARHTDDLTSKPPTPPEFPETVTPALTAIVVSSTPTTDPAARWLLSRALDVVARVVPAAPPDLAKAMVAVMSDPARSIDERVRAAIALGRTATKESGIDAATAVAAMQRLAEEVLADSLSTAKDRALAAVLSNVSPASNPQPGNSVVTTAYPLNEVEVNRDAWRLLKLSEAIAKRKLTKDKTGQSQPARGAPLESGLARLLEDNAKASALAYRMADRMREGAAAMVKDPTASRVAEALDTIVTWNQSEP